MVSVLEGGYNLRGGLVSAFARSVAAHVRALADGNAHAWDPKDAEVGVMGMMVPAVCDVNFSVWGVPGGLVSTLQVPSS